MSKMDEFDKTENLPIYKKGKEILDVVIANWRFNDKTTRSKCLGSRRLSISILYAI